MRTSTKPLQVWLFHSYVADWSLDTTASWAGITRSRGGSVREEEGEFSLSDRRRVQVYGLSQRMAVGLGERHTLDAGWEGRRFDAQLDYSSNLEPDLDIFAPFALPRLETLHFDDRLQRDHLGVWASDRWLVNDRLTVELGLRHDGYREPAESVTSPRVNLAWRMASRTVLRAGWGEYAQSQRPQELSVEDGESELERLEVSRQSVLGLEHTLAARRLGVDAFRVEAFDRRIDDPRRRAENLLEPINFFPEIEPDRVRLVPEDSLARGFEGIVKGGFGSRVEGFLAYAWSRADEPGHRSKPDNLACSTCRAPSTSDTRWHSSWAFACRATGAFISPGSTTPAGRPPRSSSRKSSTPRNRRKNRRPRRSLLAPAANASPPITGSTCDSPVPSTSTAGS